MHGVTSRALDRRAGSPGGLFDTLTIGRNRPRSFVRDGREVRCRGFRFRYPDGVELPALCEGDRFLLFSNQGRAIDEAFADIFATAVEFFRHEPGSGPLRADYLIGEDLPAGPDRSLATPGRLLIPGVGTRYPDALSRTVEFLIGFDGRSARWMPVAFVDGQYTGDLPLAGAGGAHWNSTILGHAFYLAVEGGSNATTGRQVSRVGAEQRRQIERVYLRAMTDLMPPSADFALAAAVIRQSAADLFGHNSDVWRAVAQGLSAAGL